MATFTANLFGRIGEHLALKRIGWIADDIRGTLHTSVYAFNKDTQAFVSDLTNELPTGGGYTVGGIALANKTVTYDAATDTTMCDADNITIPNSTLTWRTLVVSDRTPALATAQPLIVENRGNEDTISSGGDTVITINTNGVFRLPA